jgi:hypothetical protein
MIVSSSPVPRFLRQVRPERRQRASWSTIGLVSVSKASMYLTMLTAVRLPERTTRDVSGSGSGSLDHRLQWAVTSSWHLSAVS